VPRLRSYARHARLIGFACSLAAAGLSTAARSEEAASPSPPHWEGVPMPLPEDAPIRRGAMTLWEFHQSEDGEHPNGAEQEMLWLQNRARQDPEAEGVWLATSTEPDIANGRTFFNVNTTQLQHQFAALASAPPAAFDRRLYEAAKAHSIDELIAQPPPQNNQTHDGPFERVVTAGFEANGGRGSVFGFADSPLNAHAALNIDWGNGPFGMQDPPGHRLAIMEPLDNVGLALVPDPVTGPGQDFGPLVFTGNYMDADTLAVDHHHRFLVGTVWYDANDNDRYDDGEGVPGVTVTPSAGSFFAITSPGGGYAIPILAAGSYVVTFTHPGIPPGSQRTANVGADSELVDLELVQPVPEPGRLALFATGAAVLVVMRRRRP
jgi:hypothetical protein